MIGGIRRARLVASAVATLVVVCATAGVSGAATTEDGPAAPLVIAHRGASAEAPEHTFAAYDRAVEQGADVLECDLQLTKDEVLVCVHDTTVDRTTGGTATGRVDSFTLAELRAMDFGSWFAPEFAGAAIVPFEEQLRCYADTGVQFYAETKAPAEYGGRMEPALVALLRRLDLIPAGEVDLARSPVIVQSFDPASLDAVGRLAPSLPTAHLWVAPPDGQNVAGGAEIAAPTAAALVAQPALVVLEHQRGRSVHTWTVDDPAQMEQLLDAGVDGIFTNRPAALREIVDRRTERTSEPLAVRRGCPGVAGTVTAASDDPVAAPRDEPRDEPGAVAEGRTEEDASVDWGAVAITIGALAVVAGVILWVLARRPR